MALVRRVLAFGGLPFLSLVTPFLFLPVLARVAGAEAWLAIAIGQSVGAFAALVVGLGYNAVGPTAVALAAPAERHAVLERSIRPRLALFAPAVVVATTVAAVIAPSTHRLDAALMAIALTLGGLSSAWYMVGLGRAGLIVVFELLPRLVATAVAAIALLVLGQVTWYPALLIAAALIGSGVFIAREVGLSALLVASPGAMRREFTTNRSALTTEIAAGAHNSLAVTFVSLVAPVAQAAAYISGDKLYRIGQYSVSALGNALQGWAVEDDRREFDRRVRVAILWHLALGLVGLTVFTSLGPPLSELFFGATVAIDLATAAGFGVATLGIALGTALGRVVLVGLGSRREFMLSVLAGAAVGVASILALSGPFGAAGGAWGLALGELVSVSCQAFFVARGMRARRRPDEGIA
ncbi:polysaccharide biosynthesis protein [Microcella sp.]|uniref:polysaccharide biosynthesis protein n=1 Tax=Microcella sp. TaxID=1913979 RepID=UPI00299F780E|nr:polysaccharide biosynthesis protein [Microcella sp.]MDX2024818.1 polysaccharide biosynthesis protein [Microcella sp.]